MNFELPAIQARQKQKCLLFIDAGYFLTREVANAIQAEGHRLIVVAMPDYNSVSDSNQDVYSTFLDKIINIVEEHEPDALLTINHLGFDADGRLTELLENLGLPGLIWYVDSPRYILLDNWDNASDNIGIFLWDTGYADWIRKAGFQKVHFLPLATAPETFYQPVDLDKMAGNCDPGAAIFVGDSMNEAVHKTIGKLPDNLRASFNNTAVQNLAGRFSAELLSPEGINGKTVWDVFSELLSVGQSCRTVETADSLNYESVFVLMATRTQRTRFLATVANLIQPEKLIIYGDDGWQNHLNGSTVLMPQVDYYHELSDVYQRASAVINLTGFQMPRGLNQRCYDVPASGGFLITDHQEDIERLFRPGEEIVTCKTPEELIDKWNYYRRNPEERRGIIEAGQRRVLNEHTYRHRIREMMEVMHHWFL